MIVVKVTKMDNNIQCTCKSLYTVQLLPVVMIRYSISFNGKYGQHFAEYIYCEL